MSNKEKTKLDLNSSIELDSMLSYPEIEEYLLQRLKPLNSHTGSSKIVHISTPYGTRQSWIRKMFLKGE